jgi:pimeloyl-ACP methyl ester carboxylesterase
MFVKMIAAAALSVGAAAGALPSQDYTHAQQMVAVDGARRLNLFCMGNGEPTVLFDSGAGDSTWVWHKVQGEVAKITRACAYDRAGIGFSDAATRASDARNTVDDLHRLVQAARMHTPIVYVGHSIAGLYGTLFATEYPNEVAGIVFVDPSFSDQWQKMIAPVPAAKRAPMQALFAKLVADGRQCEALAQKGELSKPTPADTKLCLDASTAPEKLDATLAHALVVQGQNAKLYAAQVSEYESFVRFDRSSRDQDEVESSSPTFGDKPVVVLTHGKPAGFPGVTAAENAAMEKAWMDGHDRLAHLSIRGSNMVVPNSGHYIELDAPGAVIDAVKKVVAEVRAGK